MELEISPTRWRTWHVRRIIKIRKTVCWHPGNVLLTLLPELKFKSTLTLDRRNAVNTTFLDPISTAWGRNQYGEASDNRNMNTVLTFDNVFTYNKNFKRHGLEVMAGSSWTDSDYSNSWINGSHYRNDLIQTLNAANKNCLG